MKTRDILHPASFILTAKAAALLALASLAFCHSALAVDITKSDTTTMNTAAAWGGTAPIITNLGIFDNTISTANAAALTLGGNTSLLGLQFNNNLNGPVSIATGSTLTLGASGINMSAANENVTINSLIALQAAQAWNVQTGRTLTTGNNISGNVLLTLNGAGIVNLNGTNSSTTGTTVSAGTVNAGSAGAFGGAGGTLTVSGGTVNQSVLNALNSTNRLTVSGGTVNLNQSNSFSGVTTLSGGTVFASASGAMGTSNATFTTGSGVLQLSNLTAMSTGTIRLDFGTLRLRSDVDGTFTTGLVTGSTSSAGTIDVDSVTVNNQSRTLSLGSLSISNQPLNVTGGTNSGSNRFTLSITGTTTLASNAVVNVTTADLTFGAIANTAGNQLIKNGNGTLNLTGINARTTGSTTINSGIVSAQSAQAFASGAANIAVSGGVLNQTVANALTATNLLTVSSGTANLSQANNYSGSTTLTSTGVINASASGALGTSNVTLTNGTLQLSNTGAMSTGTLALNGGTLQLRNDSTTAFASGLATVGGTGTTIDVDSITASNPSRTLSLGSLNIGSQTLNVTGGTNSGTNRYTLGITGNTTLTANAIFNTTTADMTLAAIAGTNQSLTKNGTGTLNLTGADSRTTGGTIINGGILNVTGNLADTAVTVNTGGTYNVANTDTVGAVTLAGGTISNSGGFVLTGTSYAVQSGSVSGILGGAAVALTKTTAGTVTLSGSNTYTGITTISAGVLEASTLANGNSGIGAATDAATNLVFGAPTATLRYTGASNVTTGRSLTLSNGIGGGATIESSGAGTLSFDNTVALAYGTTGQTRVLTLGGTNTGANTFSKVIANNAASPTSLTKAGAGTWVLGGVNTYTGATTVNAGTLLINGSTASGSAVSVLGGTLGGTGTIGGATTLNAGSKLSAGDSSATFLTLSSTLDLTAAANDTAAFIFTLGTTGADRILLTSNTANVLTIGTNLLSGADFSFTAGTGFAAGQTYTLFDLSGGSATINGTFTTFSTSFGGFTGDVAIVGNDIVLTNVVPEPATWALLAAGLTFVITLRSRRRN